jgi:DNA primase
VLHVGKDGGVNPIARLEAAGIDCKATGKNDEYIIVCPQCNRPKLYVNPELRNWICFYCDEGGGIRSLFRKLGLEHEEEAASEFARLRAKARGIVKPAPAPVKRSHALPDSFEILKPTSTGLFADVTRQYLHKRGVTDEIIEKWSIGYCTAGKLTGHVIIPVTDMEGTIISYQARRLLGQGPKSYNPPGDAGLLFNLNYARSYPGLVLVEGPFDAMAVHTVMWKNHQPVSAVALMGTGISEESAAIIGRILKPSMAWVMLDPDMDISRGHKIGAFLVRNGVSEVRVASASSDPDELTYNQLVEALENAGPVRRVGG